jgi:hypothetical protein
MSDLSAEDLADTRRRVLECWSAQLTDLGNAIDELKYSEDIELPRGIAHDLATIETCLTRMEYWLRDELWKLV